MIFTPQMESTRSLIFINMQQALCSSAISMDLVGKALTDFFSEIFLTNSPADRKYRQMMSCVRVRVFMNGYCFDQSVSMVSTFLPCYC